MAEHTNARSRFEPPLRTKTHIEIDPETGGEISIERHERGILVSTIKTYNSTSFLSWEKRKPPITGRQALENYAETLRKRIRYEGHPTDESRIWTESDPGNWRPCKEREPNVSSVSHWHSALTKSTFPLSKVRKAGDVLNALIDVLAIPNLDDRACGKIADLLNCFGDFRVAGAVNYWADRGVRYGKGLAQGSKKRESSAQVHRHIAMRHAEGLWLERAALRNDASNTALAIAEMVNEEIRDLGLLPKNRTKLKARTIAGWISAEIGG
jgi:hypothetical protein